MLAELLARSVLCLSSLLQNKPLKKRCSSFQKSLYSHLPRCRFFGKRWCAVICWSRCRRCRCHHPL